MNIQRILAPLNKDQLQTLSRKDLIDLLLGEQDLRLQLEAINKVLEDEKMLIGDKYVIIKSKFFDKSSEKSKVPILKDKNNPPKKPKDKRKLLPSERYPNAQIIEQNIELETPGNCNSCGHEMVDSGMTEISEVLSIIPKQYVVKRQIYHKYRCPCCHGDIQTAPTLPRIKSGSSYDDDLIIDVALSKYCDLIPIERYSAMAARQGIMGIPPHSLIELTHYLAEFLIEIYKRIRQEILNAKVLHADETPHWMLEGDKTFNWYLWGFSTLNSSYFECRNTRSGDVVSNLLKESICEFLLTDVYSAYNKAVREINKLRTECKKCLIKNAYCNAHARRKFKECSVNFKKESEFFKRCYRKIYHLEKIWKSPDSKLTFNQCRAWQNIYFRLIQRKCLAWQNMSSSKSLLSKAIKYFLKNYSGLTLFLNYADIPIDNNHEERQLRSPVIGRKTWLGTHSQRGAETAAILFSIIESCKLNKINPRQYLKELVKDIHQGYPPYTPFEYYQKLRH